MRRTLAVLALSLGACYSPQHPSQNVGDDAEVDGSAMGKSDGSDGDCLGGNTIVPAVCGSEFQMGSFQVPNAFSTDNECPLTIPQKTGGDVCLVAFTGDITIGNTTITGALPVVFATRGNIDIIGNAEIEAGRNEGPGPSGTDPCMPPDAAGAPSNTLGGGGGGGGGFRGAGGHGGLGGGTGESGVAGSASVTFVHGGCAGGVGGSNTGGTPGGASGGAAFFLAGGDIQVNGNVSANGHGGHEGKQAGAGGGGGGGSGGLLGFQSHAITVSPSNLLTAKGGGGGGGAGDKGDGMPGQTGATSDTSAAPGGIGGQATGLGGTPGGIGSSVGDVNGATVSGGGFAGGGGGGGAGFIVLYTVETPTLGFMRSPDVQVFTITQP